jgi:hypothetical protein
MIVAGLETRTSYLYGPGLAPAGVDRDPASRGEKERATYVKKRPGNNGHACMRVLLLCACPLQKTQAGIARIKMKPPSKGKPVSSETAANGRCYILHTFYPPPPACPAWPSILFTRNLLPTRPPAAERSVTESPPASARSDRWREAKSRRAHTHTCASRTESGHARPAQGVRQFRETQDGLSM